MGIEVAKSHNSGQKKAINSWSGRMVLITEKVLTWRKRRQLHKKRRQEEKNPILDWVEAIGSAILIVLLVNQFLFQAYQIPSESMVPTLLVGDRIFVNKLIYGPELIPGAVKLSSPRLPRRGEVIIFENPTYIHQGPVKDFLQRVIYMATLSLVDIDKDEQGRPKHHFLIKRAIGMPGDRIRLKDGNVQIKVGGYGVWVDEKELMKEFELPYNVRRLFPVNSYEDLRLALISRVHDATGMAVSPEADLAYEKIRNLPARDFFFSEQWIIKARYQLEPHNLGLARQWTHLEHGWVVPDDRIMPMGDNRDDSRDGRDFGPVRMDKVFGRGLFHYWPPSRWGRVK